MVRCRLILQVFSLFQQAYTMITMPVSKENSHVSIKTVEHLRPALTPGVKAMHPSLPHWQGRRRHPDDWAQFPSVCNHIIAVQPRNFDKHPLHPQRPQSDLPNPSAEWMGLWSEDSQPSSACEWILHLLANISTNGFPKFLHQPQKGVCSPEEKAQHCRLQNPKLTKAASTSHSLYQFSVTLVNS